MRTLIHCLVYISIPLLVACSPGRLPFLYSVDVQQGSVIEQTDLARLRPGMTERQVIHLLGTPDIVEPVAGHRWDYVYTLERDKRRVAYERVTVFFENGRVSEVEHVTN